MRVIDEPSRATATVTQLRPRQWVKNLLVVAPVVAAGDIDDTSTWLPLVGAFVAMCLAASATYVVNDLRDLEADRLHPVKRNRPIASGAMGVPAARVVAGLLLVAALVVAALLGWKTLAAVGAYLALTLAYSSGLKHLPVVELVVVAVGFPLRTIVGGLATDTDLTTNFLLVVGSGALFVVAAKRSAELIELGDGAADHRTTLATYSAGYLRLVQGVALSVMLVVYGLWTFGGELSTSDESVIWFELSMVPLVIAVLRYAWLVDQGRAGEPEEVFLRDRTMWVLALLWAGCYGAGVTVG